VRTTPPVDSPAEHDLLRAVHVAARSAIEETRTRRFHYNVTIARFDEALNRFAAVQRAAPESPALAYAAHALPLLVAPFAPHIAEELWERLGHERSVHLERYVAPDERALAVDAITLVVQVNGKVRARISAARGVSEEQAVALALAEPNVRAHLDGKELQKRIYVPDKLLNLVAA
jgi:leucyl-tRNA synthetase